MKKTDYITIGMLVVIFVFFGISIFSGPKTVTLGGQLGYGTGTTTSFVASSTVQELLAQNTAREYAIISNSGSVAAYISLNSTSTGFAAGEGIYIPAGGSYEINNSNLWMGPVYIVTTSGTTSIATEEH